LGGEPNWQYLQENNLITEYDTSGTTISGGNPILKVNVGPLGSVVINLDDYRVRLPPTITFTIAGVLASGSANLAASITVYEDIF
jgi:hypothetical protein